MATSGELVFLGVKIGVFFMFYKKKAFRWASIVFLVWTSVSLAMLGLSIGYVPLNAPDPGYQFYFWIPLALAGVVFSIATAAFLIKRKEQRPGQAQKGQSEQDLGSVTGFNGWGLIIGGILFCISGMVLAAAHFYWNWPMPFDPAVWNYTYAFILPGYTVGALLFYAATRQGGIAKANQMRWFVLGLCLLGLLDQPERMAAFLLWAGPFPRDLSFPAEAALCTLAILPMAGAIFLMSKDHWEEVKNRQTGQHSDGLSKEAG